MPPQDHYKVLGVDKQGDGRRDQEGLPQARAPVPPRQEPRRREGRGALQADLAGARRPRRPRQAQGLRPRAEPTRSRRPGAAAAASRASTPSGFGDILSDLFGQAARVARAAGRRARAPSAAATSRPRSRSPSTRRSPAPRCRSPCRPTSAAATCARHRRQARHGADGLPALSGPRDRVRGPGPVLDLPAVLALRRRRHRHRGAVPDLPGRGAQADRQALPRQHARGRARGQPHPARRQGRAGSQRRASAATSSSSRTCPTRRSSRARATTSRSRSR